MYTNKYEMSHLIVAQCELLMQMHNSREICLCSKALACIAALQVNAPRALDLDDWLDVLFVQQDLQEATRGELLDDERCETLMNDINWYLNSYIDRLIV